MDMARCAAKYNAGYMDYKIAEMYRLTDAQRATVITRGISNEIVRRMNDKAYWHFFDDKTQFNEKFARWIGRDWLKADEGLTLERLSAFLEGKDAIMFKPLEGLQRPGHREIRGGGLGRSARLPPARSGKRPRYIGRSGEAASRHGAAVPHLGEHGAYRHAAGR